MMGKKVKETVRTKKHRGNAHEQNLLITLKPELYFHMKMEDLH